MNVPDKSVMPTCDTSAPTCGACDDETEWDGNSFACYTCGLNYGDGKDGTPASYIDPSARRCGQPCSRKWHKLPTLTTTCGTCVLPNGHGEGCYTDCRVVPAPLAGEAQPCCRYCGEPGSDCSGPCC